jgi:hypothetical protein
MNIKREVEILKSMGFEVTEASLQAEKDKHAARVAEDVKRREADRHPVDEAQEIEQAIDAELKLQHVYHKCDKDRCFICEGPLLYCVVCGQGEVELTEFCPGPPRTAELIPNRAELEAEHLDWLDMKSQESELRNQA